jgi:L,D-transpeptidase ErfK/SrfK
MVLNPTVHRLKPLLLAGCLAGGGLVRPQPAAAEGWLGDSPVLRPSSGLINQPALQSPAPAAAEPAAAMPERKLVLLRGKRQLLVLDNDRELRRFPVAVGMPGWETPVGRFAVIEKRADPVWKHPATGEVVPAGPTNPLGSRWIGFLRDCRGRSGFNGQEHLKVEGCVTSGFHGTPNRGSVGRAVSHGCVRLFEENVQELFDLVQVGTVVTVVP